MSGSSFGTLFRITTFGESHGPAIGCVIDGVPAGLEIPLAAIQKELDRRRPGQSPATTARREADEVEILSGVWQGRATGTPLALLIRNSDQRSADYAQIAELYRPGHADFTYDAKYGFRDYRGGGRASGRETAARVAAGAVAKLLLQSYGVKITACTLEAAGVRAEQKDLSVIEQNVMRAPDLAAAERMLAAVRQLQASGDSAGGVIECVVSGVPAGWGEPVFDKLDALLAHAIISIGAVKGIEFGAGFAAADLPGSVNNDALLPGGFAANRAGGVLGGISSGQDIVFRAVVKPTPSIASEQRTVDFHGQAQTIAVTGRHDPCIVPRAVPVVEAMTALVLADLALRQRTARMDLNPIDGE